MTEGEVKVWISTLLISTPDISVFAAKSTLFILMVIPKLPVVPALAGFARVTVRSKCKPTWLVNVVSRLVENYAGKVTTMDAESAATNSFGLLNRKVYVTSDAPLLVSVKPTSWTAVGVLAVYEFADVTDPE